MNGFLIPPGSFKSRVQCFLENGLDLQGGARQKITWWVRLSSYKKRIKRYQEKRIAQEARVRQFRLILELLRLIPRNTPIEVSCDWNSLRALRIHWSIPGGSKGKANFVFYRDEWRMYPDEFETFAQLESGGNPGR